MFYDIKNTLQKGLVIGYGVGEYAERVIKNSGINFDYLVDDDTHGQKKYGFHVYNTDYLVKDINQKNIVILERNIAKTVAKLINLGFKWGENIYDTRFFGSKSDYYDNYTLIKDINDLKKSPLIELYKGVESKIIIKNIIIQHNNAFKPIKIYLGYKAKIELKDIIIGDNINFYVGTNGSLILGCNSLIESNTVISASNLSKIIIGNNVLISNKSLISSASNNIITIGDYTTFGPELLLYGYAPIAIGASCMFSNRIFIASGDGHDVYFNNLVKIPEKIDIGSKVWFGLGSCILAGGCVGDGSIIGAYSVVNQKINSNCMVIGNPARTVSKNIHWSKTYKSYDEFYKK